MVEGTKEAFRRRWVRWLTLGGTVGFLALAGSSCMYDKDKPCGDDWDVDKDANGNPRCVCPVGSVYSPTGCIECGENQIVQGAACVCEEGFIMGSDNTCQEAPPDTSTASSTTGAGGTSNTGSGGSGNGNGNGNTNGSTTGQAGAAGAGGEGGAGDDGTSTENTSTESTSTDGGSTTSTTGSTPECTVNVDCGATEICDAGVCRNPTGWGAACTTSDECAGFEAGFCDAFQMKCTVSNCSNVPDTCPGAYECCDLTGFGEGFAIMCIPDGYCTTPAP